MNQCESADEPEPQPGQLDTANLVREESYTGLGVSYAALPTWNRSPDSHQPHADHDQTPPRPGGPAPTVISHTPIMSKPHRSQEAQP